MKCTAFSTVILIKLQKGDSYDRYTVSRILYGKNT